MLCHIHREVPRNVTTVMYAVQLIYKLHPLAYLGALQQWLDTLHQVQSSGSLQSTGSQNMA